MNHAVRSGRSAAQGLEIFQRTPMNFGPCRDKRRGARIRASQAEYGVSPRDQFWDNGRADESSRAGNKDPHKMTFGYESM
jgi:hypothetical protein